MIDGRNAEYREQIAHYSAGVGRVALPRGDVKDGRDTMRRNKSVDLLPLCSGPDCGRGRRMRRPVEEDVEHDVQVEEESPHRYLRSR